MKPSQEWEKGAAEKIKSAFNPDVYIVHYIKGKFDLLVYKKEGGLLYLEIKTPGWKTTVTPMQLELIKGVDSKDEWDGVPYRLLINLDIDPNKITGKKEREIFLGIKQVIGGAYALIKPTSLKPYATKTHQQLKECPKSLLRPWPERPPKPLQTIILSQDKNDWDFFKTQILVLPSVDALKDELTKLL
jgi:hypothetical protein